jgi:ProP effector
MPPRKVVNGSSPLIVIRKKKTHPPTPGASAKNGKAAAPAPPVPRPAPTPAATPSPHIPPSPQPARPVASPAQAQPQSVAPRPAEPAPPPNHRQRDAQAQRELLKVLRTRWPLAFPQDPHLIGPLMRGVHQEIATHLPGTSLSLIKRTIVLFQRLSGSAYWRAVLKGGLRYALDGSPCGEVTPPEQAHARQTLALWKTQREARRQAAFRESGTPPSPPDRGHSV